MCVRGVDEAVSVANDTAYGLSSVVFGRDVTRAMQGALEIDAGSCHVNGSTVQNEAQAPYGGTKDSGYRRFDGRAVIDEFTELKCITLEPPVQPIPSDRRALGPPSAPQRYASPAKVSNTKLRSHWFAGALWNFACQNTLMATSGSFA